MNRVNFLENLPKNPSQVIRDNFPDHDESINRIYDDYRLGAYLLRLVAATNRRLEAWLIESEGDLFEHLYHDRTDSRSEKITIFKKLFGKENVKEYLDFKYQMDEEQNEVLAELYEQFHSRRRASRDFLICVHFSQVPWMVSKRRGYLRKGWVISNEASFRSSLKKAFERLFQQEIDKARGLLGVQESIDQAVQDIEQKLAKHTQIRSRFSDVEFEGRDLQSHPEIFPPCMIYLYSEFNKTGRLIHVHRLQLGFFLKKIGMNVDDQLHYWYEKSVDNVGVSFTEFQRTSGYQIRHLYGLEGGKKDYNVPKCSTIATSYFCPFVHLDPEILAEFLRNNFLTQKKSRSLSTAQISRVVSRSASNPTLACVDYFQLIFRKFPFRAIVHPMQWARSASRIEGLIVEGKTNASASNQIKEEE
jgi:DNA primase large subunit